VVADVIADVGFLWVSAVVMVSAVAGVPAAVVILTALDISEAPAVATLIGLRNPTIGLSIIGIRKKLSMPSSVFYQSVIFFG
jgi:hypothetical protein